MWLQDWTIETADNKDEVATFLSSFSLRYDFGSDITLVAKTGGRIVGTGSLLRNVLQCFAVEQDRRGIGLSTSIVDRLLQEALDRGYTRLFVFTVPDNIEIFQNMGFRLLAETRLAALLQIGVPTIEDYMRDLKSHRVDAKGSFGGLVMNCNPFTLGHQYLIEKAADCCEHVYILVVEEDQSVFPHSVRQELVKKGTAHLANVTVLSSGPYAVSLATFPSYFSEEETAHAEAGASIDATLYGSYIAKALGITHRFVGSEPFSPVTAVYNATMDRVLVRHGVTLVEIPRLEIEGKAVSASRVREALRTEDYGLLSTLVPRSTLLYLRSSSASSIVARLRTHKGRH